MSPPRIALFVLCAVVPAIAYRLGGASLWYVFAAGYGAAAALSLFALAQDGQLRAALLPRAGDATVALVPAMALFAAVTLGVTKVLAPIPLLRVCGADGALIGIAQTHGFGAFTEWLRDRSCAAFGHGSAMQGTARAAFVITVAGFEELAWRAGVQQALGERLGSTRGWLVASVLYAAAFLGTGTASLALLALPTGLAWGAMYRFRGRVAPAVVAHMVFSWALLCNNAPFVVRGSL